MGFRDIYYARRAKMPRGRDWAEAILRQAGFAAKVRGKASIPGFIVHTDRGRQYTSVEFKSALEKEGLHQSMAQYAWQNVYCERVNRTTKEGYLAFEKNSCIKALQREVTHSVKNYITGKPHRGLTARLNPRVFIRAQANGEYGDYTVKIFSKLTSTKQLYVNKNINLIQASTQISL
jgi:transposase InsO family protein